ncbi:MAG: hypothetical protein K0S74_302 [Chlamydiales bacterium]|jgi:hypothetical protein|nr:hypothetical protein [Chlamydiales bacterium]
MWSLPEYENYLTSGLVGKSLELVKMIQSAQERNLTGNQMDDFVEKAVDLIYDRTSWEEENNDIRELELISIVETLEYYKDKEPLCYQILSGLTKKIIASDPQILGRIKALTPMKIYLEDKGQVKSEIIDQWAIFNMKNREALSILKQNGYKLHEVADEKLLVQAIATKDLATCWSILELEKVPAEWHGKLLEICLDSENIEIFDYFIQQGFDAANSSNSENLLSHFIKMGDKERFEKLISLGCKGSQYGLLKACIAKNRTDFFEMIFNRQILETEISNLKDKHEIFELARNSVISGALEIFKILSSNYPEVLDPALLILSMEYQQPEILQFLIEKGCNPYNLARKNMTAFTYLETQKRNRNSTIKGMISVYAEILGKYKDPS